MEPWVGYACAVEGPGEESCDHGWLLSTRLLSDGVASPLVSWTLEMTQMNQRGILSI